MVGVIGRSGGIEIPYYIIGGMEAILDEQIDFIKNILTFSRWRRA